MNVNKLNTAVLLFEIDGRGGTLRNEADSATTVAHTMATITRCGYDAMPKMNNNLKWKKIHWWNASIEESRRNYIQIRRYTRAGRRGDAEIERSAYKVAKKKKI